MPILRKTEIFEEFVMEKKIIYLKAEQSSYVNHEKVHKYLNNSDTHLELYYY